MQTRFGLDDTYDEYIIRQQSLWHLQNASLAEGLSELRIVRDITDITYNSYISVPNLIAKLADKNEN